jgi:hypothetical protein
MIYYVAMPFVPMDQWLGTRPRPEYPTEVAPRPGHVEPNVGAIAFLA